MTSSGVTEAWLALRRERFPTWTWLNGEQIGNEFSRQNWKPFMICGNYHMRDRVMEVDNCTVDRYGYICQGKNTCASYPVNSVDCLIVQGRVFVYGCYAANWYEARHKCRKLGMDLAVMTSADDRKLISRRWHDQDKKHCTQLWVGLRKDDWLQEGELLPATVLPLWAPGQPRHTDNCSIITTGGASGASWRTADCNRRKRALCFRKHDTKATVTSEKRYVNVTAIPTPDTAPSPAATTNTRTIIIVVIICVAVLILLVAGICLFIRIRKRNRKMTNPYLSWASYWNQGSPDGVGDDEDKGIARPLMQSNQSIEESHCHGFTCILVARQDKLASGLSLHTEITLEIFAFQRQGHSVPSAHIQDAMNDKPGIMLRKDLHVNMPQESDDQNECTLVTELTLDDSEMQTKGTNSKEVGLDQLLSQGGAHVGLQIAQFIIERTNKNKVRPFRINIKFSWKKGEATRMSAEYTDVVQCNKLNEAQKHLVKQRVGFNQSRPGSRHGSFSWRGSNKEFSDSTAQRHSSFSRVVSNREHRDSTAEIKDTVDSGHTAARTPLLEDSEQTAVPQGMLNDQTKENVPPESKRNKEEQIALVGKDTDLTKTNVTPATENNLESKYSATDGTSHVKNTTEDFIQSANIPVQAHSPDELAVARETETTEISKDKVLETNQESKVDNPSHSLESKEAGEKTNHESTVDTTDQISRSKERDQETTESHASENGTRKDEGKENMNVDLPESKGDDTEKERKAEEGTPETSGDATDIKNKHNDTSDKTSPQVHDSVELYVMSINTDQYGFSTPV